MSDVKVDIEPLKKLLNDYMDIVAEEVAKDMEPLARGAVADARQFNTPDVTGDQDDNIKYAGPYIDVNKNGVGKRITVRFYGAEYADVGSLRKFLWLEHNLGPGGRGQFFFPAVELARPKLKRIVPVAAARARRRVAAIYKGT